MVSWTDFKIMKQSLPIKFLILVLVFGICNFAFSQNAESDSTQTQFPQKVKNRSTFESILAFPGKAIYFPFDVSFKILEQSYHYLFDLRAIDRFKEFLTTEDGRIGIRPTANSLNGYGARVFFYNVLGKTKINVTTQFGEFPRANSTLSVAFPKDSFLNGSLTFFNEYNYRPNANFFGIGNKTNHADSTFLEEQFKSTLIYKFELNRNFSLGLDFGYDLIEIGKGETPNTPQISRHYTGVGERAHFLESATFLKANFTDNSGSPNSGNNSLLRFGYNQSVDDDKFSNLLLAFTTEQFLEIYHKRTISLKVGTDWRFRVGAGDEIAFYNLAFVGGNEVLKGFEQKRFRDRGNAFGVLTYKFPVWKVIDGVIFYERGRVFKNVDDFSFNNWKESFGGGLNFWTENGIVLQLTASRSKENSFLFSFNFNAGI